MPALHVRRNRFCTYFYSIVSFFYRTRNRKEMFFIAVVNRPLYFIIVALQIMPLKQIKLEYQPFEAKRNLSNMYDVYLADATVMRLLPEILGKAFYGRKR